MVNKYQVIYDSYASKGADIVTSYYNNSISLNTPKAWQVFASNNLTGLLIPKHYGGAGLSIKEATCAIEAISYQIFDLGVLLGLWAHNFNAAVCLLLKGTKAQNQEYLPLMANGAAIFANAITENDSGSDPFAMKSTVLAKGNSRSLYGQKTFITNATIATHFLTFVRNSRKGFDLYIIATPSTHFHATEISRSVLTSCSWGTLYFNDYKVSPKQRVGQAKVADKLFAKAIAIERLAFAASNLGVTQRFLEECYGMLKKQKAGFAQNQYLFHQLAKYEIQAQAARKLVMDLSRDTKGLNVSVKWAAACKFLTSDILVNLCNDFSGFILAQNGLEDTRIVRVLTDSSAAKVYSGTTEMMLNIFHINK